MASIGIWQTLPQALDQCGLIGMLQILADGNASRDGCDLQIE